DLAVADLASAAGLRDRSDHGVHLMIRHHQLQLHLGEETDLVFHAAVPLDIAALAAAAAHLAGRHPDDPEVAEQGVDLLKPLRPDDALDLGHGGFSWLECTKKKRPGQFDRAFRHSVVTAPGWPG